MYAMVFFGCAMLIEKGKLRESAGHKAIGPNPNMMLGRQPVAKLTTNLFFVSTGNRFF